MSLLIDEQIGEPLLATTGPPLLYSVLIDSLSLFVPDVPECKSFGQNYRRLVRSLDFRIANPPSMKPTYVELAGQVDDYVSVLVK